jgi:hypothetical protein
MGILANVMPGVRAIRAPLAAGVLLLLSAWIAFEGTVPEDPASGIWASVERLEPVLSTVGTVGLIAFAAYVIGSLYLVVVPAIRAFILSTERPTAQRRRLGLIPRIVVLPDIDRAITHIIYNARNRGPDLKFAVSRAIRDQLGPPMSVDAEERLERYVTQRVTVLATDEERQNATSLWEQLEDERRHEATDEDLTALWRLARLYLEEWQTLPLTIVGTQPHLYGEFDRFDAEAEFRRALQGPLAILAVVVGVRVGGWGIVIGTVIAAVVIAAFAYAALDARRRANTVLANGIAAGLVPLRGKEDTDH